MNRQVGNGVMVVLAMAWVAVLPLAVSADTDTEIAELERKAATAGGSARVALLNELAAAHDRIDPDEQVRYGEQALALARREGDRPGEAGALFQIGCGRRDQSAHQEALAALDEAAAIYESLGATDKRIECAKNRGWVLENMGEWDRAMEVYQQALVLARSEGLEQYEATLLQYSSVIHIRKNQLDDALEQALAALVIQERLGKRFSIASTRFTIGSIYCELGEYERCLEYYLEALPIYRETNDLPNLSLVLTAIGVVYENTDRPQQALEHYQESLGYAEEVDDRMSIGYTLGNMAGTLLDLGRAEEAEDRYRQQLQIWREVGNQSLAASTLGNMAGMYVTQQRFPEAFAIFDQVLPLAEELDDASLLHDCYNNRSEAYKALGDFERALADYELAVANHEKVVNLEKQRTISELQEKYASEEKRRQIELLEKDLEIQKLELSRARLRTVAILGGFLLLVASFLLLFRRYLHLLAFWKKRSYISHYKLDRQIGSGGMGVVYEATDLVDKGRSVALKVIRDELARDPVQRKRFLNEAYLVDQLDHPNIIKVYERGEHQQTLYIAMELLDGRSLAEVVDAGERLAVDTCLEIVAQLADALDQIHRQGIVHRDVKAENVMLLEPGDGDTAPRVKLLDFGLARAPSLTKLTTTGEILGTITYLSPEQISVRRVSPACDIYAAGVVLYELLTMEKPFLGDNPGEIIRAILDQEPLAPVRFRPDLAPDVNALVMRMLAKEPEARPDAAELISAVTEARAPRAPGSSR